MENLVKEKQEFLKTLVPVWELQEKERENKWVKPENEKD